MTTPVSEYLRAQIDKEIESVEHSILHGQCPDYATYRAQCAMLAAYQNCLDFVKKAFAGGEEEDDS